MSNINEIPQGSWWYSYINLKTKNFDFFMKILSPWPCSQGHPRGGDGADKNFRPVYTIMPNMNEIHQRLFKIWGLINFNAKTDPVTERRTNEQTYVRTNKRTNGKAKTIYPHILRMSGVWWWVPREEKKRMAECFSSLIVAGWALVLTSKQYKPFKIAAISVCLFEFAFYDSINCKDHDELVS